MSVSDGPETKEAAFKQVGRQAGRRPFLRRTEIVVLLAVIGLIGCLIAISTDGDTGPDSLGVAAVGSSDAVDDESSGEPAERSERVSVSTASVVFAGLPLGTADRFYEIADMAALRDLSAATIMGTYVGYESVTQPELMIQGYAGPQGVLRLYFRVDSVLGGTSPVREAPGREGAGVVAVDYDYWVAPSMIEKHRAAMDSVKGQASFVLVLEAGTVDSRRSTGAYRLWSVPLGAAPVDADGRIQAVDIAIDYVAAEAIARGEGREDPFVDTENHDEGGGLQAVGVDPSDPLLGSLYGRTVEDVKAELTSSRASQELLPPGEIPVH